MARTPFGLTPKRWTTPAKPKPPTTNEQLTGGRIGPPLTDEQREGYRAQARLATRDFETDVQAWADRKAVRAKAEQAAEDALWQKVQAR